MASIEEGRTVIYARIVAVAIFEGRILDHASEIQRLGKRVIDIESQLARCPLSDGHEQRVVVRITIVRAHPERLDLCVGDGCGHKRDHIGPQIAQQSITESGPGYWRASPCLPRPPSPQTRAGASHSRE